VRARESRGGARRRRVGAAARARGVESARERARQEGAPSQRLPTMLCASAAIAAAAAARARRALIRRRALASTRLAARSAPTVSGRPCGPLEIGFQRRVEAEEVSCVTHHRHSRSFSFCSARARLEHRNIRPPGPSRVCSGPRALPERTARPAIQRENRSLARLLKAPTPDLPARLGARGSAGRRRRTGPRASRSARSRAPAQAERQEPRRDAGGGGRGQGRPQGRRGQRPHPRKGARAAGFPPARGAPPPPIALRRRRRLFASSPTAFPLHCDPLALRRSRSAAPRSTSWTRSSARAASGRSTSASASPGRARTPRRTRRRRRSRSSSSTAPPRAATTAPPTNGLSTARSARCRACPKSTSRGARCVGGLGVGGALA
jgi:hypothetical protein